MILGTNDRYALVSVLFFTAQLSNFWVEGEMGKEKVMGAFQSRYVL
jgi:hypothetical protein